MITKVLFSSLTLLDPNKQFLPSKATVDKPVKLVTSKYIASSLYS